MGWAISDWFFAGTLFLTPIPIAQSKLLLEWLRTVLVMKANTSAHFQMCCGVCLGIVSRHYHALQTPITPLSHHLTLWMFHLRVCSRSTGLWRSSGNSSKAFSGCKCTRQEQVSLGHCECVRVWKWKCMREFLCSHPFVFLHHNVSSWGYMCNSLDKDKCDTSDPCRFVKLTATSPPTRQPLHLMLCITWVASMWSSTWCLQQMTSSGTGECDNGWHGNLCSCIM